MKKIAMMMFAFTLLFSTVGSVILLTTDDVAEAKSYRSGKKGFQQPYKNNNQKDQNKIQQDKDTNSSSVTKTTKDNTTSKKGGFSSGGFMRGLMVGGLAGLLFGSLFSDMGALGSLLGFMINVGSILLIVYLVLKIYYAMKRKNEATNQWRR